MGRDCDAGASEHAAMWNIGGHSYPVRAHNLPLLPQESVGREARDFLVEHIKTIIIGPSQGYSMNLELKGIGYTAKISENLRARPQGMPQGGMTRIPRVATRSLAGTPTTL